MIGALAMTRMMTIVGTFSQTTPLILVMRLIGKSVSNQVTVLSAGTSRTDLESKSLLQVLAVLDQSAIGAFDCRIWQSQSGPL